MANQAFEEIYKQLLINIEDLTPASLTKIFISVLKKNPGVKKEEKEKKELLPCDWSLGCTKKCLKVRRIEGKVYCSRHHQRMTDKIVASSSSSPSQPPPPGFDFSNEAPVDYKKIPWKFTDYSEGLLIHSPTNLVVSLENLVEFPTLVGLHENNELIPVENLDICITSWARLSNIYVSNNKRCKIEH